jgi:3-isopropylmalate/(R)-2-methylmalate dehydratase large subunit
MGMTMIEKILAVHSGYDTVKPGDIIDVLIDTRVARDFGGANVIKNLDKYGLHIDDPQKTMFTFDCNPTGSDQKYAVNQQICRTFARQNGIRLFDIDAGIGTHLLIDNGTVFPGSTLVSTDSHANILGAIGAFGQGMGDVDIAAAWSSGKIWFKVPESVKIILSGNRPSYISAKDVVLNLLGRFGANDLLGFSVEFYGEVTEKLTLDERMTISSMATEMGAIIFLFPPSEEVGDYFSQWVTKEFKPVYADSDSVYAKTFKLDVSKFRPLVSLPGAPHDTADLSEVYGIKIDSAFIGSCTNGRMEDMKKTADILYGRKVAPGVVLKIVPATDFIWRKCLEQGLLNVFKNAGALVSNAGCAGCAAGQVGQNGPGEIVLSTGNRNFPGKQGKGSVYLASPEIVASSAIAGFITTPDRIPDEPAIFRPESQYNTYKKAEARPVTIGHRPEIIEGKVWYIRRDNIDTDMIFHNRYLTVTDLKEMGSHTFENLEGNSDFAARAKPGDIVFTGKNFGSGSSRQQAVDCFISLGIRAIVARSFGSIYERNAINAALPVVTCPAMDYLELVDGNFVRINLATGKIENISNGKITYANPFPEVQLAIYKRGSLL